MTQEEKAKAYDEAIKRAKALYDNHQPISGNNVIIDNIFPELRESEEEERTINCIGMCLTDANEQRFKDYGTTLKDCLAWLKKQGEKESNKMHIWKHWKDGICGNGEGKPIYLIKNGDNYIISSCLGYECDYIELSELDKLISDKDSEKIVGKIVLKFKVGDWIVNKLGNVWHIDSFDNKNYKVTDINGNHKCFPISIQDRMHLWTIQDVKDGDVLACDINKAEIGGDVEKLPNITPTICIYQNVVKDKDYIHNYSSLYDGSSLVLQNTMYYKYFVHNIHPATKEQRDLLFTKMKEAGYEWDAKKKELKIDYPDSLPKDNWELIHEFVEKFGRIPEDEDELNVLVEYVLKRQKYLWSEEDERICQSLIEDQEESLNYVEVISDLKKIERYE